MARWRFQLKLKVLLNLLGAIFVLVAKSSMVFAAALDCPQSLKPVEFELDLTDPFLFNKFKIEPRFSTEKVEQSLRHLVLLPTDKQKEVAATIKAKVLAHLAGSVAEILLLGVYDFEAWRNYIQREIGNFVYNTPQWWNRAYLFENMPSRLRTLLLDDLRLEIRNSSSPERAKRASRILTSLRIVFEEPGRDLLKAFQNKNNIHSAIENYFTLFQNEVSHYKNSPAVTVGKWVKLIQLLQHHFLTSELFHGRGPIYWFGSIPNGRGKMDSDFDFSSEFNFSVKQTEDLNRFLLREAKDLVSVDLVKGFDMKTVEYMASNLLFMSPMSVLFKEDKVFLVVRELIAPVNLWALAYGEAVTFGRYRVRLHHFPVEIDSAGRLQNEKEASEFITEY